MKWIVISSLSVILFVGVVSGALSARWNEKNCPSGSVTDFVCCDDNHCQEKSSEEDCHSEVSCLWNSEKGKCLFNRDDRNNVCCQTKVNDICDAITKGRCPLSHQVPSGCCSNEGLRWEGILTVNKTGYVCCNAPCTDMEKMKCEVPPSCNERSIGRGTDRSVLGFRSGLVPANFPLGQQYGGINFLGSYGGYGGYGHGFGFGHSYSGPFPGKGIHDDDYSKDRHTKEITADDVLTALIDALSHDDDVFTHNQEIRSDPVYGKEKFGGLVDNFNFADPNIFLDSIYGLPLTYGGGYYGHGGLGGYGGFGFGQQRFGSNGGHTRYFGGR